MLTMKKIQTRGRVETIPEDPIMIFALGYNDWGQVNSVDAVQGRESEYEAYGVTDCLYIPRGMCQQSLCDSHERERIEE